MCNFSNSVNLKPKKKYVACINKKYLFTFLLDCNRVRLMVFNATFNNISAISWWLVLLVEETGEPRENFRPVTDKLYHIKFFLTPTCIELQNHTSKFLMYSKESLFLLLA